MVILHNAIKTIQNGVFMFFEKRMKTCFFKKKKQKRDFEKTGGLEFFENTGFLSTLTIFQSFLWFSLDRTIWNNWRHYQFDWACAVHLE